MLRMPVTLKQTPTFLVDIGRVFFLKLNSSVDSLGGKMVCVAARLYTWSTKRVQGS